MDFAGLNNFLTSAKVYSIATLIHRIIWIAKEFVMCLSRKNFWKYFSRWWNDFCFPRKFKVKSFHQLALKIFLHRLLELWKSILLCKNIFHRWEICVIVLHLLHMVILVCVCGMGVQNSNARASNCIQMYEQVYYMFTE